MAVFQVEVVIGAVEIGGHYGDVVGAVLQVEALAQLQTGNLGDGIRFVGVFQGRGQQAIFLHGLRSLARIDAGASQEEQFLHAMAEALAYHVLLYLQVLVDEVCPIVQVGQDASHVGGGQYHGFRLFFIEELADGHGVQ